MHSNLVTVLSDRLLLANGTSVVEPSDVPQLILNSNGQCDLSKVQVTESSFDVEQYNLRCLSKDKRLNVFDPSVESFEVILETVLDLSVKNPQWLLPEEYQQLDLFDYFSQKLDLLDPLIQSKAELRVAQELEAVEQFNFTNGLKTIIYIVDTFRQHKQVWGVGRGSSCASYLLFLVGIHCVDCIKYNIDLHEFFHV